MAQDDGEKRGLAGFTAGFFVATDMVFWMCDISASTVVMVIRAIGALFGFAWMIAGCVWVFRTDRPPPNATVEGNGCDPVVYNAAYVLVILALISWGTSILGKLCSCLCGSR
ncbi:uncharacterized protein LOC127006364 isoform X2 [Eriocheir sinensis]|uniref:uncharacterized protein LOC127006364 isoform X2 n=1 Tax=Eriocheir sinensis TaxID=95602 RepID=UPI0021C7234C|nr:uncharacterized protein LOC127006364 isoform X2 [Eriocheir sinensis]